MSDLAPHRGDTATDRRIALLGAIVWPSFFAAGVATMVLFALIDPNELFDIAWPHVRLPREIGYTVGFFVLWAATFGASAFTALLLQRRAFDELQ